MTDSSISATAKPNALPLFTSHGNTSWTVQQIKQAFTEIHYSSFDFIPGKGKKDETKKTKVTAVNAHIIGGVLHFFEKAAAKICDNCPAFRDTIPKKTITGETLRKLWNSKVEYRVSQRSSWGKGPNAFHETGDGDFPELDGELGDKKVSVSLSKDEKFDMCFLNAQIDDILDAHLAKLCEHEEQYRKGQSSSHEKSGSAVAEFTNQALVLFQKDPSQTCFGKLMKPAAKPGHVAAASLIRRSEQSGEMTAEKRRRGEDCVQKSLNFGNSVVALGEKMLDHLAPPKLEDIESMAKATATAYASVVRDGVLEGVACYALYRQILIQDRNQRMEEGA
jgi:hypothetical protein